MIESLRLDLRYAARTLRQSPLFTTVAVLTLALGIGANSAVFSVVNAVLLTPPPFDRPEQLVLVTGGSTRASDQAVPLSYPNYADLRARTTSLDDVAAWTSFANTVFNVTGAGEPERVQYALATANLFSVLRVKPVLGRAFSKDEDQFGSGPRVALVSNGLWKRRFGADSAGGLAGKSIILDGVSYAVIGVLPTEFTFVAFPGTPDIWLPLGLDPISQGRHWARGVSYLGAIARVKPGVVPAQIDDDLRAIASQLRTENQDFDGDLTLRAVSLQASGVASYRRALAVLLAAVGLLLLIACANVANLLLARATRREREVAIRLALGASARRIVQGLLTESMLLALIGGVAGVLVATWGVSALTSFPIFGAPDVFKPYAVNASAIHVDVRVLLFTLAVSIVTGLLFGAIPALQTARSDLHAAVKAAGARSGVSRERRRLRELLVVGEIALSLVLLTGAGLLLRSLARLSAVDPGFRAERVLSLDLSLPPATYREPQRVVAFYDALLIRASALSGVQSAGLVAQPPLSGPEESSDFRIAGRAPPEPGKAPDVPFTVISADYFRTMGIRLVAGRQLNEYDDARSPRVAIINEAMARKYWPDERALGKRLTLSIEAVHVDSSGRATFDWQGASREVVGVVRDVRHDALSSPPGPEAYLPYRQFPERSVTLVLRATGDPTLLAASTRREVTAIDRDQPISRVRTMDEIVATSIGEPRFRTLLLGIFAAFAVALAAVGIYGVMSYSVTQRAREIGIRAALGAERSHLTALVVLDGMKLAGAGIAVGVVAALAGTRALRGLLYNLSPTDGPTFVAVTCLLAAVALVACYVPARRATKVQPMEALRDE